MEFEGARKYGLKKWGNVNDANVLGGCAAKDMTVNFTRAGSVGAALNEIIMFFNANVQGLDKAARALGILEAAPWARSQSRTKTMSRSLLKGIGFITIMSVANYYRNRDEEWWQELPAYEKWNYIHLDLGFHIMRFPLPFDAGPLFGALPVAAIEEQRNPGAFKEALGQAVDNLSPIDFGGDNLAEHLHSLSRNFTMIAPLADIAANRDWKGAYIVNPNIEKYKKKEDQYGPRTSELAKILGGATPYKTSPAQIDHLLNGYSGGLYNNAAGLMDTIMDPSKLSGDDPSTWTLLGKLFLRHGSSKITTEIYDRQAELRQKKGSKKASVSEIGELATLNKLTRELTGKWESRREAFTNLKAGEAKPIAEKLLDEIHAQIREHNKRDDFFHEGAMSLLYAATSPSASQEDKDIARRLLENTDKSILEAALRDAAKAHGSKSFQVRTSSGKLSDWGIRRARMTNLGL